MPRKGLSLPVRTGALLAIAVLAACLPAPPTVSVLPPIAGRVAVSEWRTLAATADLVSATISLVQPANGLAVAAGNSRADGSFILFLPPAIRPGEGSTWYLDVVRRRGGRALGLRTVVQWTGSDWTSCTGSKAGDELAVTTATTAAARIVERAGLPLATAIGSAQGGQVSLAAIDALWPRTLHARLQTALATGDDPLAVSPAVIVTQQPETPRGGDLVTWQGFGFGGVTGKVQVGDRELPVRLWQDRTIQAGLPAGLPAGTVTLRLANGEQVMPGAIAVPDAWRVHPPLRRARGGESVAAGVLPAGVVIAGGQDGSYGPLGAVEVLKDGRQLRAPLTVPRYGLAGAVLDGRFYALGGIEARGISAAVEAYDPATDAWARQADLPQALYQPAAAVSGAGLYVFGGEAPTGPSERIYRLTPGGGWQVSPATLQPPRAGAAAVALPDGRIVIAGGRNAAGDALALVEVFDPESGTLSPAPRLRVPRYAHAAGRVGQAVVVAGGWQDGFGALASVEGWSADQPEWTPRASLPAPRFGATGVSVGSTLWVVAGANDGEGSGADVLEYVP